MNRKFPDEQNWEGQRGERGGVSQESPFLFGPQEPSYYDLDLREEDPGNDLGQLETEP